MRLNDVRFIADENIHNNVIDFLRERGFEVKSASDDDLAGGLDIDLLSLASETHRGIITHDSDFGTLVYTQNQPYYVILFVRPGHFDPNFTIETLAKLIDEDIEINPPTLITTKRVGDGITVRIKNGGEG
jgi:predicted nuclease of predicted toxin-antitoxin system